MFCGCIRVMKVTDENKHLRKTEEYIIQKAVGIKKYRVMIDRKVEYIMREALEESQRIQPGKR